MYKNKNRHYKRYTITVDTRTLNIMTKCTYGANNNNAYRP